MLKMNKGDGRYQDWPIVECHEPLQAIEAAMFCRFEPHPYVALGAPYGRQGPWYLRQGVLQALQQAQEQLRRLRPGWQLKLFDAWRPLAVQHFMVWQAFQQQAREHGISLAGLAGPAALQQQNPAAYTRLAEEVFRFWSVPDDDPAHPPPHSTGAAVDVTLADAAGCAMDMGSPIDEISPRSWPDHFATATTATALAFHERRELLLTVMQQVGFCRHPNEWWHFSLGDQLWAWQHGARFARYGRVEE